MQTISMVITNGGDGSNAIAWVLDEKVLERMEKMADNGSEWYASGDGLQARGLSFPDDFDLSAWIKTNHLSITTLSDLGE